MNKMGFGFLRLPEAGGVEGGYDWEKVSRMVDRFMEMGGQYFDTCYTYLNGMSERGIRECVVRRKPRGSFILAEKLPGYNCRQYADCQKFFEEELARCGVEYFDVLMLHWLNGENYAIAERYDEFRFLREKKAEGKARRIGFSYHDSASLLDEILTRHPEVDLVQLQINYLDWEAAGIESRKCYEVCVRHGKKVVVMEPCKGGTLAVVPPEAEAVLRSRHPDWSPAGWAMRFAQSLPEVEVVLSGMNDLSQVEENLRAVDPLDGDDLACLERVRAIIESETAVPCTGCRYCVGHCPKGIPIPDYFKMYNEICRYPGEGWKIRPTYAQAAKGQGRASDCIACRSCERHCPQRIPVADVMRDVAEKLE